MPGTDLNYLSAIEVRDLYRSRELSPVEFLESVIQRADEIDETVNPFAAAAPPLAPVTLAPLILNWNP